MDNMYLMDDMDVMDSTDGAEFERGLVQVELLCIVKHLTSVDEWS